MRDPKDVQYNIRTLNGMKKEIEQELAQLETYKKNPKCTMRPSEYAMAASSHRARIDALDYAIKSIELLESLRASFDNMKPSEVMKIKKAG